MRSDHDPADCLADILENIERIQSYVAGLDRDGFRNDGRSRDAVERCLERVCEAAFRLGDAAPALMPGQRWGDIRGMGNRLRHAYDRIRFDVLWNVVSKNLPTLKAEVQGALTRIRADTGGNP
ncbi:MAG TPA: HepT-like ribonuclease domain-containing protein [Stellaceae bacterium]|nr:HepT-like ribonuclease domain-containing protein [Stellaceae bacterium]